MLTQNPPVTKPWVHGPVVDLLLGWCWLPVGLLMHNFEASVSRTQGLMAIVFVISFAHQPLTLGLVYGDRSQQDAHRTLYRWAPITAAIVIFIGVNVSLTLVALMAGLWNAEHTLMQRYGLMRIYGRKAGDSNGGIEKPMLVAWLVTALLFLGAFVDLDNMVTKLGMDRTNSRGVELLDSLSAVAAVLFWVAVAVSIVFTAKWVGAERGRFSHPATRAKWIYTLGTVGLVALVMIDPIAGIAGYVAAHAIEYFGIVHTTLRRRGSSGEASAIAAASATPTRRGALYLAYFAAITALIAVTWTVWDGRLYAFAILFFGALHILYDGFVWKLRQPAVAASLGI
jgi:uncharacterized membrane protein YidH (DUF202 family)